MKYAKWLGLVILFALTYPIAIFLAPLVALWSIWKNDTAPQLFYYLLTPDNTLDGDSGHRGRWPGDTFVLVFLRRTAWQWRNTLYNFRYDLMGVKVVGSQVAWSGDTSVESNLAGAGWQYGGYPGAFSYFAYFPYGNRKRGVRIYLGWKFKNRQPENEEKVYMLAFAINPVYPSS